jgi:hypothetical protein
MHYSRVGSVLAATAALYGPLALAQQPCVSASDEVCLSWAAPTQNTDNSPIDIPITYRVYRAGTTPTLLLTTQALRAKLVLQPSGNQCYFVTANTIRGESAPSNQACKFIRPRAPTDGAIEAPSDGAIEDRR